MHLKRIHTLNVKGLVNGAHEFCDGNGAIRRWIFLPAGPIGHAMLKGVALACIGRNQAEAAFNLCQLIPRSLQQTGRIVFEHSTHAPQDRSPRVQACRVSGWEFTDRQIAPASSRAIAEIDRIMHWTSQQNPSS